jgi:hypothetical protein
MTKHKWWAALAVAIVTAVLVSDPTLEKACQVWVKIQAVGLLELGHQFEAVYDIGEVVKP